jgi:hypothetical protein
MVWRTADGLMATLFVFAVVVQHNDPDPLRWMAIYAAAALVSVLAAWQGPTHGVTGLAALVGLVALTWAIVWCADMSTPLAPLASLFGEFEMRDAQIEETREALGLGIVAAWCVSIALRGAVMTWGSRSEPRVRVRVPAAEDPRDGGAGDDSDPQGRPPGVVPDGR